MPEGHIVERIARLHRAQLGGQRLAVDSPQGRFSGGAAALDGRTLVGVTAYGKHSFHRFRAEGAPPSHDLYLHVHLGLYGKWRMGELPVPDPVGQIRVRMVGDSTWAELRGAARCEAVDRATMRSVIDALGEDPLHSRRGGALAYERFHRSRRPIGLVLMDQTVLAGVGNVYRAEVLFRHGLSPHRPAMLVGEDEWGAIWLDLMTLMRDGVRRGRIVTTRPEDRTRRRGPVPPDEQYYVYRRTGEPCRLCGTPVRAEDAAGRTLYWCPTCQPSTSERISSVC